MKHTQSKYSTALGRPIAYFPRLAHALGSANAAIVLSKIIEITENSKSEIGEHISLDDLAWQTGMSVKELCAARKILRNAGAVTETEKRLEHKIFYAANKDFIEKIGWNEVQNGSH